MPIPGFQTLMLPVLRLVADGATTLSPRPSRSSLNLRQPRVLAGDEADEFGDA
jgi:hypothetical protein